MRDKNILRTLALTVALSILGGITANIGRAVIIEGFTEAGNFRSVLVSPDGRLLIATSSGVAQAIFFISSQPVNAFQATTPWITQFLSSQPVNSFQGTDPWIVQFNSSQPVNSFQGTDPWIVELNAAPEISTAAILNVSIFTINAVATEVLAADQSRKSSLICNESTSSAFFDFTVAVTTPTGKFLPPGACFSPDNPVAYVGALFINTTDSVRIGVVEITQ